MNEYYKSHYGNKIAMEVYGENTSHKKHVSQKTCLTKVRQSN